MKRNSSCKSVLILLSIFIYSASFSQDIIIDASTFNGTTISSSKTDFTKPFTLEFVKNKKSTTSIFLMDENGVTQKLLKKGIKDSDAATIKFQFTPSEDGRNITVKLTDGSIFKINSTAIQLFYGGNSIIIGNESAKPDDKKPNPNSLSTNSTPIGIEIHDAILAKKYYSTSKLQLFALLSEYKKANSISEADILTAWSSNPFIKDLLQSSDFSTTPDKAISQGGGGAFSSFVSNVGNTDVTTIADGFAKFLVKRTKQELSIAFFRKFKELINKPEYKDAQKLFPKTMEKLNAIDQEIYLFENYMTSLRESFENDLSLILDHMPAVIEDGHFKEYFNDNFNLKYSLLLTLFSAKELINGTHPGKVLETLPQDYLTEFKNADSSDNKTVSGTFETLQLLSKSIRSRTGDNYWTSLDTIQMLYKGGNDFIIAKFYLGLLWENCEKIEFNDGKMLRGYLTAIATSEPYIKEYIKFVKDLGKKCHDVESAIMQVKIKKGESASVELYNRLFNSFADVVEHINGFAALPGLKTDSKSKIAANIAGYLKIFRQTNDLALNVVQKNYASGVVNVYNIYLAATEIKQDAVVPVGTSTNSLLFAKVANKGNANEQKSANENAIKISAFIKKYGNFMANVVKAKTSEEVAAAIESFALPAGSASIKRNSDFNIALNGYVGLYLGYEKIRGVDDQFKPNAYGITAPIGISISHGWGWNKDKGKSISLFLSVIDLGAPVSFRFKDDKTEEIPTIQLKDIVSPGVFVSLGFGRIPISMNVGWQMGPLLRKLDASVANKASGNYDRFSLAFLVDMPILNFIKRPN